MPQNTQKTYTPVSACDIFELEEAQKLLGPAVAIGANEPPADLDDLQVSSCSYTVEQADKLQEASLTVRAPKTDTGATSNHKQFEQQLNGRTPVPGLGDQAYWDTATTELNVLKRDTWLTIINGSSVQPNERTLAAATQMAKPIVAKIP